MRNWKGLINKTLRKPSRLWPLLFVFRAQHEQKFTARRQAVIVGHRILQRVRSITAAVGRRRPEVTLAEAVPAVLRWRLDQSTARSAGRRPSKT